MIKPDGVIVPLLTPLDNKGNIDNAALCRLLDHVINGGVDGVFVAGTTGEFARLDESQRHTLFEWTTAHVAHRVPVYAGVSDTSLAQVKRHMRAASYAGVDAFVLSLPYYFPITDLAEAEIWFTKLLSGAERPCLVYNIPGNTGTCIPPQTLRAVRELICGFKDSGPDEVGLQTYMEALGGQQRKVSYLSGNEALTALSLALGANGLVPSQANVFPSLWATIWKHRAEPAKVEELMKIVKRVNTWNNRYPSSLSSVMWKKRALELLGIIGSTMSIPSSPSPSIDDDLLRQTTALVAAEMEGSDTGVA